MKRLFILALAALALGLTACESRVEKKEVEKTTEVTQPATDDKAAPADSTTPPPAENTAPADSTAPAQ